MLKKEKNNDIHEFQPLNVEIENRPLNPLGRAVMWIILLFILIAGSWLYFGKIDIVVSAKGSVIPQGEIKILQPIETGVVSKILIKEGQFVKKGQILMQIDPEIVEENLEAKEQNLLSLIYQKKRLSGLVHGIDFISKDASLEEKEQHSLFLLQKKSLNESVERYELKEKQLKDQLDGLIVEKNNFEDLFNKDNERLRNLKKVLDIIAKKDYVDLEKNVLKLKADIKVKNYAISQIKKTIKENSKEKDYFVHEFIDKKHEELIAVEKEISLLTSEINAIKFQSKKQKIVSPVDGHIIKLFVNTIGGVVTPAEEVISVLPITTPLIVKANVMNQDIGFIQNHMESKIKIDTFEFQKYGFLEGQVINVGSYSLSDEKIGSYYEVKISPKKTFLTVEGKEKKLEAGMSVTAEIKVGKRRIIEFFVYPIVKYLDEGMSVR